MIINSLKSQQLLLIVSRVYIKKKINDVWSKLQDIDELDCNAIWGQLNKFRDDAAGRTPTRLEWLIIF